MKRHFKKILFCVIFFSIFGFAAHSHAADYYIAKDATGTGDGSSWANAATDFPDGWKGLTSCAFNGATWVKGTTYWVAGSDTPYTIGPCVRLTSGTGTITFKKATAASHGTDTGWVTAYGTKQAVIPEAIISQSVTIDNVIIDGSTGSGTTGYGFLFNDPSVPTIISIGDSTHFPTGIVIKYCEISPSSILSAQVGLQAYFSSAMATTDSPNLMIENNYVHDIGNISFLTSAGNWFTIQNNVIQRTCQMADTTHKAVIKDAGGALNVTIRRNSISDWQGQSVTGGIEIGCNGDGTGQGQSYWHIYNNLFYYTSADFTGKSGGNRVIGGLGSCPNDTVNNIFVYNNTFSGISDAGAANIFPNEGDNQIANSQVMNNLFYNDAGLTVIGMAGVTKDYNWFYLTPNYTDRQTHDVSGSADPFANSATYDFSLNASTTAINTGLDLSAYFTTDYSGNTRQAPWDIGAYEYASGSSDTTPPAAPSGLSVS